jgi:hypothetical protein
VIAWAMVEPPARVVEISSNGAVMWRAGADTRSRRQPAGDLTTLMKLIVPASLLGSAASAASFLAQTAGGADPGRMTVLVAIVALAEAAGSTLAARITATGVRSQTILASFGAVIIATALTLPAAFLPAVVALSFLLGVAHPLRAAAIQRLTADTMRARTASIASACDKASTTVALVCAGMWPRRR